MKLAIVGVIVMWLLSILSLILGIWSKDNVFIGNSISALVITITPTYNLVSTIRE
ncbi:hypothetical protein [Clostridium perfringens]|uniref:hypothetical protein n=1 Tax=Clostridium perfringens TaxID=1502 RepID=UPI002341042C|nr:hypothetical protein [Clostridium perfringens]MDC4245629.1 hypothetical protein [Clostridium perfringens]